ncbi:MULTISPECIES: hypothetical protein [Bradyrhizobium]|uniref:hypothetical protein n=1 Tax=Bradyrhizobium TaxID=374 RepID=UPI0011AB5C22|nr:MULTISPECIES: hypothetical protein [Bradyrhizobium]
MPLQVRAKIDRAASRLEKTTHRKSGKIKPRDFVVAAGSQSCRLASSGMFCQKRQVFSRRHLSVVGKRGGNALSQFRKPFGAARRHPTPLPKRASPGAAF